MAKTKSTQYIGVQQGQSITVIGVPTPTGGEHPSHPIVLPGDPGWPKPPPGPVDPGYSPPWAQVPDPVDPGYSPPWAQLPIDPPVDPPPVDPPKPQEPGHWLWAYCPQLGRWIWVRVPGPGEAGPKRK